MSDELWRSILAIIVGVRGFLAQLVGIVLWWLYFTRGF